MAALAPFDPEPTRRRAATPRPAVAVGATLAAPAAAALVEEPYRSLGALVEAIERLATAVVRHDAPALEAATSEAADLVARIERLAADGIEPPPTAVPEALLRDLTARLEASARLAAHLIERAWASEAAALQLLARCLGREAGPAFATAADEPRVLERRA